MVCAATYRALGQLPGLGVVFALVLVVGLFLARADLRTRLAPTLALLVGSVVFMTINAIGRASALGDNAAKVDRYVYIVAAMSLPALAAAADAIARRYPILLPFFIVLFLVGIPGNINAFNRAQRQDRSLSAYRHMIFTLAHDPVAGQAPPSVRPEPVLAPQVTMGWLTSSARGARIPKPSELTARDRASDAFRVSFLQQRTSRTAPACATTLALPTTRSLAQGDVLGLYEGPSRFRGASDAARLTPPSGLVGPPLSFAPKDGTTVTVLRDVPAVRISASSPFFPPRVCLMP